MLSGGLKLFFQCPYLFVTYYIDFGSTTWYYFFNSGAFVSPEDLKNVNTSKLQLQIEFEKCFKTHNWDWKFAEIVCFLNTSFSIDGY